MNKAKQLLIVLPICFVLSGLVAILYFIDPTFVPDSYRVTSMVIVVLLTFFIIPSVLFDVNLAKDYFKSKNPTQAFASGVWFGVVFGLGGLLILSLLFAPLTGAIWFVQTIRQAPPH